MFAKALRQAQAPGLAGSSNGPHRVNALSCPLVIKAEIAIGFEGWKRKFCRAFDLQHGYFVPRAAFKMFVPLYFSEMSC